MTDGRLGGCLPGTSDNGPENGSLIIPCHVKVPSINIQLLIRLSSSAAAAAAAVYASTDGVSLVTMILLICNHNFPRYLLSPYL